LDFRNCIQAGVVKINIYTDLVRAAMERIQCEVAAPYSPFCQNKNKRDPAADNRELAEQIAAILMPLFSGKKIELKYPDLMRFSTEEVKVLVQNKMKLFGSSGRA
jgi:fructose/tagatose bisphosphate aldolase